MSVGPYFLFKGCLDTNTVQQQQHHLLPCVFGSHKICWTFTTWTPHLIHIHKVQAHTGIIGNEKADILVNKGTLKEKPTNTPHIHLAHATPYWLASCPTATHNGAIRTMHKCIIKEDNNCEIATTQRKFPYVEKWLTNKQINKKLSNHFWKKQQSNGSPNHPNIKI